MYQMRVRTTVPAALDERGMLVLLVIDAARRERCDLRRQQVREIVNLGSSSPVLLRDLIETVEKACGRVAVIERVGEQPGDVPQTWADVDKAGRLLGYRPQTDFREGVARFAAWLGLTISTSGSQEKRNDDQSWYKKDSCYRHGCYVMRFSFVIKYSLVLYFSILLPYTCAKASAGRSRLLIPVISSNFCNDLH
jgi:hypothetical protein